MTRKTIEDNKPWYKQFWPWFLIALPLSSVVAGINMLIIANDTTDSMVVDDYYKDGLAINEVLAKKERSKELGISALITFDDETIKLVLQSDVDVKDSLFLRFQHATLETKDFTVALKKNAIGNYYSELEHDLNGKWMIRLYPYQEQWEVEKKVFLPSKDGVLLGVQ